MTKFKTLALAATALSAGTLMVAPAVAQKKKGQEQAAPAAAGPKLSKEERAAIVPLEQAFGAKDWAAVAAALPAAEAAAQGPDAKYLVAARKLAVAQNSNDQAATAAAIQALIASRSTLANELQLQRALGSTAYNAKDYETAARAFERVAQLNSADPDAAANVAKIRAMQKQYPQAVTIMEQRIAAASQGGAKAPETDYKLALQYTLDGKLPAQGNKLARELVIAYPTPENWRLALDIYRSNNPRLDQASTTDLLRLMRAAKLLKANDYIELAENLNERGLPGETKAVLDEGIASRALEAGRVRDLQGVVNTRLQGDRASLGSAESKAQSAADGRLAMNTADAYLGYGEYAKAAALYRTALQKGGVDAATVNTRLGIALAMAGNKAEAQTAFGAVTGPRADIANYWVLWLNQRA